MEQVIEQGDLIRKYVLGDLAEEKHAEMEIRLFTDQGYFDKLLLVEDEIKDDFFFGALSDHEQERTRNYFLAIPGEELRFVRALEEYAAASPTADKAETILDNSLAEAERNRVLLGSLIKGDWMGLHLLALLRAAPQRKYELASILQADEITVTPILTNLILSDVLDEHEGLFSCTELGRETLRKIEEKSGVQFTP